MCRAGLSRVLLPIAGTILLWIVLWNWPLVDKYTGLACFVCPPPSVAVPLPAATQPQRCRPGGRAERRILAAKASLAKVVVPT